jgi:hypothetical protein
VTIDGGEAFVFGSWLVIDTQTTVSLAPSTSGQTVSVGWNKNGADDVIVGLDAAFSSASGDADQKIPLFKFDTDGNGVTNVVDERSFDQISADSVEQGAGSGLDADTVDGQEAAALGASAGDNLSKSGNTLNVIDGSGSGLDADVLDGEDVSFTSPEDEEIIVYDADAGEWREQDAGETLIQKFDQDVTVTVGAGGDFATLNGALEHLTDRYPQYTQAEGQEGGFTAVVRMLDDFVMEEQVLVDGIHLDWIRLETTRGSGVQEITDIAAGDTISGFAQAEETTITFEISMLITRIATSTESTLHSGQLTAPMQRHTTSTSMSQT